MVSGRNASSAAHASVKVPARIFAKRVRSRDRHGRRQRIRTGGSRRRKARDRHGRREQPPQRRVNAMGVANVEITQRMHARERCRRKLCDRVKLLREMYLAQGDRRKSQLSSLSDRSAIVCLVTSTIVERLTAYTLCRLRATDVVRLRNFAQPMSVSSSTLCSYRIQFRDSSTAWSDR